MPAGDVKSTAFLFPILDATRYEADSQAYLHKAGLHAHDVLVLQRAHGASKGGPVWDYVVGTLPSLGPRHADHSRPHRRGFSGGQHLQCTA